MSFQSFNESVSAIMAYMLLTPAQMDRVNGFLTRVRAADMVDYSPAFSAFISIIDSF